MKVNLYKGGSCKSYLLTRAATMLNVSLYSPVTKASNASVPEISLSFEGDGVLQITISR